MAKSTISGHFPVRFLYVYQGIGNVRKKSMANQSPPSSFSWWIYASPWLMRPPGFPWGFPGVPGPPRYGRWFITPMKSIVFYSYIMLYHVIPTINHKKISHWNKAFLNAIDWGPHPVTKSDGFILRPGRSLLRLYPHFSGVWPVLASNPPRPPIRKIPLNPTKSYEPSYWNSHELIHFKCQIPLYKSIPRNSMWSHPNPFQMGMGQNLLLPYLAEKPSSNHLF